MSQVEHAEAYDKSDIKAINIRKRCPIIRPICGSREWGNDFVRLAAMQPKLGLETAASISDHDRLGLRNILFRDVFL
ncbi:uncharacterized protein PHALS_15193 [Plasmopara halstedii]|uniref:Uncharacterized protein n=1 Tax=Plasmopara halstedii TaxID=4781 RepID=A0A0P1B2X7_PLAHL|nr:uncharacterized protein PHALS_15193 [Plasmopara halstedii]CEG49110.1 hypothetical protein PHALS_15193 [Plasmopara halstedii]|eukprot:XP_024585479.1 hypothetical protein PHALS_15193 [Plasmopara halstedii]